MGQTVWVALIAGCALFAGCGPENPQGRRAVSGKVTLDGAPLELGNIVFDPLDGGTQSGGQISGGSYAVPTAQGVAPGKYRVSITDFVPSPAQAEGRLPGDPLPPSPKPKVPPDWNTKSKQTIEVKKEGPFKFDFEIKTK
jgi:hypothetical protein